MATRRCMPPLSSRTGFWSASPRPSSVSRATISARGTWRPRARETLVTAEKAGQSLSS